MSKSLDTYQDILELVDIEKLLPFQTYLLAVK